MPSSARPTYIHKDSSLVCHRVILECVVSLTTHDIKFILMLCLDRITSEQTRQSEAFQLISLLYSDILIECISVNRTSILFHRIESQIYYYIPGNTFLSLLVKSVYLSARDVVDIDCTVWYCPCVPTAGTFPRASAVANRYEKVRRGPLPSPVFHNGASDGTVPALVGVRRTVVFLRKCCVQLVDCVVDAQLCWYRNRGVLGIPQGTREYADDVLSVGWVRR